MDHAPLTRFLYLGGTGFGKSTLLNMGYNRASHKEALESPAPAGDSTEGVTSAFTSYWNRKDGRMFMDSVGFGDNRFSNLEDIAKMLRLAAFETQQGFNKFFVVMRYGRVSSENRRYLEFVRDLFGTQGLSNCVLILTFAPAKALNYDKEQYVQQLQKDGDTQLLTFVRQCSDVLCANTAFDDDSDVEEVYCENRKSFLTTYLRQLDHTDAKCVLPVAQNLKELLIKLVHYLFPSVFRQDADKAIVDSMTAFRGQLFSHYFDQCAICISAINELPFATQCGHLFHTQCLLQALERKKTCPLCNQKVDPNDNCFEKYTKT